VRQISIPLGQSLFTGKMTLDGKALDTSMTEPGYHFLIHFERLASEKSTKTLCLGRADYWLSMSALSPMR